MKIAILTGGKSSEREIALQSAKNVFEQLKKYFEVEMFDFPSQMDQFIESRTTIKAVVPVFHGKGGEDGEIQGFLQTLGVPYIFSTVFAHALAMNKDATKNILTNVGMRVPKGHVVEKGKGMQYEWPCVVKPNDGGSSIGISLARSQEELDSALGQAFLTSDTVLVEQFIAGREFTVAVIEKQGSIEALPVIEIRSKNEFFDYESKYDATLVEELVPAPIDEELAHKLKEQAIQAHIAIQARHLTRTDFIVDSKGKAWILEINTIPGQTINSLVPKAVRAAGYDMGELMKEWIEGVM